MGIYEFVNNVLFIKVVLFKNSSEKIHFIKMVRYTLLLVLGDV